jgi:ribosomal protein L11 methyltransferase
MSFGTGHHESTRLILNLLPKYVKADTYWMDAGTGTGVLAIAAVKLGAKEVFAFDNDEWVRENVAENLQLNQVTEQQVPFAVCSLEDVQESGFDGIIANIHLVILQQFMPLFAQKLKNGAPLLLAGLLKTDKEAILNAASAHGFTLLEEITENEWMSIALCVKH